MVGNIQEQPLSDLEARPFLIGTCIPLNSKRYSQTPPSSAGEVAAFLGIFVTYGGTAPLSYFLGGDLNAH